MIDRQPFAFAGLWDEWNNPDGSQIRSCTIVTTEPNELMASIHNRMPLILPRDVYEQWIDPAVRTPDSLDALVKPYPAKEMAAYPVSTLVNDPKNDYAENVVPV
jgi:putative SOS response-associated peptidase YedK